MKSSKKSLFVQIEVVVDSTADVWARSEGCDTEQKDVETNELFVDDGEESVSEVEVEKVLY